MDFNFKALAGAIPLTAILAYFHLTGEVVLIYGLVAITDTILAIVSQYNMGEQITSEKWTK